MPSSRRRSAPRGLDEGVHPVRADRAGRAGELLALQWSDVQGDALIVSKSIEALSGRMRAPKSGRARRIPLHLEVLAVLARRGQDGRQGRILPMG